MTRACLRLLCALPLAWCISACSQGEGEPCQIESDCSSGLVCCAGDSTRGVCRDSCPGNSGGNERDGGEAGDGENAGRGGSGGSSGRGGNGGSSGNADAGASTEDSGTE